MGHAKLSLGILCCATCYKPPVASFHCNKTCQIHGKKMPAQASSEPKHQMFKHRNGDYDAWCGCHCMLQQNDAEKGINQNWIIGLPTIPQLTHGTHQQIQMNPTIFIFPKNCNKLQLRGCLLKFDAQFLTVMLGNSQSHLRQDLLNLIQRKTAGWNLKLVKKRAETPTNCATIILCETFISK